MLKLIKIAEVFIYTPQTDRQSVHVIPEKEWVIDIILENEMKACITALSVLHGHTHNVLIGADQFITHLYA